MTAGKNNNSILFPMSEKPDLELKSYLSLMLFSNLINVESRVKSGIMAGIFDLNKFHPFLFKRIV